MGESDSPTRRASSRRRRRPSPSPDSHSDDDRTARRSRDKSHRSHKRDRRRDEDKSSRRKKRTKRRERDDDDDDDEDRRKRRRARRRRERRKARSRRDDGDSTEDSETSSSGTDGESSASEEPEELLRGILGRFPEVAADLKQILQMLDGGQAVDIGGIPDKKLIKMLKEFFWSLNVKKDGGLFLLPVKATPTLDIVGRYLDKFLKSAHAAFNDPQDKAQLSREPVADEVASTIGPSTKPEVQSESSVPQRRRLIGPEMPSSELLAAAAELTDAHAALRDAETSGADAIDDLFIGPPPPAVAAEAASANEAERFEEVERIMGVEASRPYDVLGVNHKMPFENIKKRYWKLSLMVHPDKCSHPQAHQAFVLLNLALKELQDPDKKKAIDDNIKIKEEEEAFKIELKALREAAQWRRLQGISLEGDEELLAEPKGPEEPQRREEWMTQLPPERKPGMTTHSTFFSRSGKEGRGDTSVWTDSPLEKTEKAKQNFLEAYNKTAAIVAAEDERKKGSAADLVDMYNRSKRSMSLVEKHQQESRQEKKQKKQKQPREKEGWEGQHPWKPWDRENDLTAGRKKVKLDSENMAQGLASRFSSGAVQRNFL